MPSLCRRLAGGLTLFSGFGLGTLLMPVVALFFPVQTAIAVTAAAHPVLLLAIIGSSLVGTVLAARFIKAVTMSAIRTLISLMLISIALGLGTGLL